MAQILLVEDDSTVRESVSAYLERSGYRVRVAADGSQALSEYAEQAPDLVLLDLMLPELGGFEVCRRIRAQRADQPVIMLTARGQEHERVQGLQHGADDYVTKPFSLRELELRVRTVLRRAAPTSAPPQPRLVDGDLVVDVPAQSATLAGRALPLTAREIDLLQWFLTHPGTVWSRDDLLREVWGWQVGDPSTVTVHVHRLREKVEADPTTPARLVTVFGRGYRWDAVSARAQERSPGGAEPHPGTDPAP